jgi:hypothetical protein
MVSFLVFHEVIMAQPQRHPPLSEMEEEFWRPRLLRPASGSTLRYTRLSFPKILPDMMEKFGDKTGS